MIRITRAISAAFHAGLVSAARIYLRLSERLSRDAADRNRIANAKSALAAVGLKPTGMPSESRGMNKLVRDRLKNPRPAALGMDLAMYILRHPHDWSDSDRNKALHCVRQTIAELESEIEVLERTNAALVDSGDDEQVRFRLVGGE